MTNHYSSNMSVVSVDIKCSPSFIQIQTIAASVAPNTRQRKIRSVNMKGKDFEITFELAEKYISEGKTQKEFLKKRKITKPTLAEHLKKKKTTWKEMLTLFKSKQKTGSKGKDPNFNYQDWSKKDPKASPHSPTGKAPPPDVGDSGSNPGGGTNPQQQPIPLKTQIQQQTGMAPTDSYILEIRRIQSLFTQQKQPCTVKDAITLKDLSDNLSNSVATPPWYNPPVATPQQMIDFKEDPSLITEFIASPKQMEIMNAVAYGPKKIIMIEGTKRTGKSTFVWLGLNLANWNGTHKRWRMYGASETNAMDIHEGMKTDPLTLKYTAHLEKGNGSKLRTTFFNNGFLQVMSTGKGKGGERRSSGTDCDAVWIDESHSVLIDAPKTLAMAAMILLASPNLRIVFSMNREGEAYEMFKNLLLDKLLPEDIHFITITDKDVFHITKDADRIVRVLVEASAGEDMVAQYMDNQYVKSGDLVYPRKAIMKAFEDYDTPAIEAFDKITCGIDWGQVHDTAMNIIGYQIEEAYELETIYLTHPTPSQLIRIISRLIREYPGIIFIWETSPLGAFARVEIRRLFPNQRFIDSTFTKHKENYIDNVYIWLQDEDLHLKDPKLKRQLLGYINDKKNDDGHDALAHNLYKGQTPRIRQKIKASVIYNE